MKNNTSNFSFKYILWKNLEQKYLWCDIYEGFNLSNSEILLILNSYQNRYFSSRRCTIYILFLLAENLKKNMLQRVVKQIYPQLYSGDPQGVFENFQNQQKLQKMVCVCT